MLPATPGQRCAPAPRRFVALFLVFSLLLLAVPTQFIPIFPTAAAATGDLFFSEYIEGTSNNKALEVYNPTGAAVNLATAGYTLEMYFNGSASAGFTLALSGTVAANGAFVIAPTNANATILAAANQTSGTSWFNGDDAVVLKKGGVIVDSIGQVGFDPGAEWGSGLQSTADNTIRRKSTVCTGDANAANVFDPSVEWDGFATDTFAGLGSHTASCNITVAPSITTHPQGQTITAGQTATLNVVAAGTAPLSYQWYQGAKPDTSTPVGTNSDSFTTPVLTTTTSYWVRVSNSAGTADSNTATVTVNAVNPGTLQFSASAYSVAENGGSATITVTRTGGTDGAVSVDYATGDGSAVGNTDYTPASGTLSFGSGENSKSFSVPVIDDALLEGDKTVNLSLSNAAGGATLGAQSTAVLTIVENETVPAGSVVISQVYGGGGNSGAQYKNDFIEIFNRSANPVNLSGWSVQYASASGNFTQSTPLTNVILQPGQYYLVQQAAGSGGSLDLPAPDKTGTINMSGTSGKVALARNNVNLSGTTCAEWLGDPDLMDFVGYGTANCFEGAGAAPELSNTTAALRSHDGCKDTNYNAANFSENTPNPRNTSSPMNTCPAGDLAPVVFGSTPVPGSVGVPLTSNIQINFDEPVNVSGAWFQISCSVSGLHTAAVTGGTTNFTLDPDADFASNDLCTVTVYSAQVNDLDAQDPPDQMEADHTFTFRTVIIRNPAEHLVMGNPSNAAADPNTPNNYLLPKNQFVLSYNCERGTPNWVSWHLDSTWIGTAPRQDDFRGDPAVPAPCYQVQTTDYTGTGFDRGHMTPSADRTSTVPDNSATFLMTNIVPQAPNNNQGPWEDLETAARNLVGLGNELYIISGPHGVGGVGRFGPASAIAGGNVTVPSHTWKVVLVLPVGDDDVSRVNNSTRAFGIIMPNDHNAVVASEDWEKYLTTVDAVEALTGYDFFSNVEDGVEAVIEGRLDNDANSAPVAEDQSVMTAEDAQKAITLTASDANVNNKLTYTVVTGPAHGTLGGAAPNLTYTPDADYHGPDSFTFKANDGGKDSNTATVSINVTSVNDAPVAAGESYTTDSNTPLSVPAPGVLSNDSDIDSATLSAVPVTGPAHGTLVLNPDGSFVYTPAPNYAGPDSFTYKANDGAADSNVATVQITVNDKVAPVINSSVAVGSLWPANGSLVNVGFSASATDNFDGPVATQVFVYSDEDDLVLPGGNASPDARDIASGTLRLRAEREGSGDGRVYLIIVVATDAAGNTSHSCHTVVVPNNASQASVNSVNQQAQAAHAHCEATATPPAGYFVVGDGPVAGPKQ